MNAGVTEVRTLATHTGFGNHNMKVVDPNNNIAERDETHNKLVVQFNCAKRVTGKLELSDEGIAPGQNVVAKLY